MQGKLLSRRHYSPSIQSKEAFEYIGKGVTVSADVFFYPLNGYPIMADNVVTPANYDM